MVGMGTGSPNVNLFPFQHVHIKTKFGEVIEFQGDSLNAALQYGSSQGCPRSRRWPSAGQGWALRDPKLLTWLRDLQERFHGPRDPDYSLIITPGSSDGLSMLFAALVEPGDSVLIEDPTYSGTLAGLRPLGVRILGVETDEDGLRPDVLRDVLKRCPPVAMPKLLVVQVYCTGARVLDWKTNLKPGPQNPSGRSVSLGRRMEILKIASDFDLLIIEDDPYYFLNFQPPPPSFFSLDTEGRVIRLDSFSKMLSAGFRLGYVSGPSPVIERLTLHLQVTSMQSSSFTQAHRLLPSPNPVQPQPHSQAIVRELLQRWGQAGLIDHAHRVSSFYEGQCSAMVEAAGEELGGEAEWARPTGGMFLWIRALHVPDTAALINTHALANKVVLAPGNVFFTDPSKPCPFLRASYSNVTHQQMREGMKRLGKLLRSARV